MSTQPGSLLWQQVDQRLASLMLAEVSEEFRQLADEDLRHIRYQNIGNGNGLTVPSQRLEMHRLRTDELAARHYAVYCEVWRSQQKPLTPEFLRAICPNTLQVLRSARINGVSSEFSMEQMRTHSPNGEWLKSAMAEFKRGMDRLYAKWEGHAEVDAKGLEYMLSAAPNNDDMNVVAMQVVHARSQLRIVETRLASIKSRIAFCKLALSATHLQPADAYRIKSLEQHLEGLHADKKQFDLRRGDWQRSQDTALSRSAQLGRQNIYSAFSDGELQSVSSESQPQEEAHLGEQPSVSSEPNCAGVVGPEREIAQARERVRYFEAEIAAVDTKITALRQSLTEAIVRGSSVIKPRDIDRMISRLHGRKKDLELRRDEWQQTLNIALSRSAKLQTQGMFHQPAFRTNHGEVQELMSSKAGGAQIWHGLHIEFKSLAEEELRRDPNNKADRWLRAHVTKDKPTGEQWDISDGVDEGFRARFDVLATRAGIALGAQLNNSPALEFWLHALFEDLRAHRSRGLFAADEKGGIILRVCEASATYSARLERAALEQTPFAHASFPLTSPAPLTHTDGKEAPSDEQKPTGTADSSAPAADPREDKKQLPARKRDLSKFLDAARLTERQRDCISLRLEYGLTVTEIAQHLDIGRKTVDEHIAAARRKIDVAQMKSKGKTQSGKTE